MLSLPKFCVAAGGKIVNYQGLFDALDSMGQADWHENLQGRGANWFSASHHGDFERWNQSLKALPEIEEIRVALDASAVTISGRCLESQQLKQALMGLSPWRKGPYQVADTYIDTEWRSDFKWDRVYPHLASLSGRRVLDVGCGNGYHAWRMLADDPHLVIGIDPSVLFNLQFQAIQHYVQDPRIWMLPMTLEQMPVQMSWFDSVFSMGVLYHRKSPFEHLMHLRRLLRKGGELCLETLVIEGGRGHVLVPESRYARMNNVWFLPSTDELEHWLGRCGFTDIRLVDVNRTGLEEQRSTSWMTFESLDQCLDPDNPALTVEGYPAPLRAVFVATG